MDSKEHERDYHSHEEADKARKSSSELPGRRLEHLRGDLNYPEKRREVEDLCPSYCED